ncbi:MAG: DUF3185 domain-containing protein [Acidobacteriota bacterium]|nr:DUF3185 domain-containing protein [Acidobacteriota bacterium]
MKVAGLILIVVGFIGLAYGGFTYTTHKKELDMGPIQVEKKVQHSIPIPPILGAIALVAGGAMVFSSRKPSE